MTSGIVFVATLYCTIYHLLYQEFLTEYVQLLNMSSIIVQLFLSLTVLAVIILLIGKPSQVYWIILLNIAYQYHLLLSPQCSYQIGTPLNYPYQPFNLLSNFDGYSFNFFYQYAVSSYQLSNIPIRQLHEVIISCTCMKSFITYSYKVCSSLAGIQYPNKTLFLDTPISYSSVTIQFFYSQSLPYQRQLSAITVSLLHRSCSHYLLTGTPFSYLYQQLLSTPISYSLFNCYLAVPRPTLGHC